ncbi:MAG TPA: amidase [Solirubrobacterales bacterium]|jgi:aspartyl-tRNA(Asn)/glutamyl-tRNA(Gln) amidotransferase subunit A
MGPETAVIGAAGSNRGTDLAYLGATEALVAFAARALSPVELLEALIERAAVVEPAVNAFAETMFEAAREEARRAERRWAAGTARPLEGLPVAAKESQALAGHAISDGLAEPLDPEPAASTAWALERLRAAGAIVHARTTTSELCCMPMSHAARWGTTRNPWDLSKAVGGSSGGSAAALAAGTATLATGTDIGGSVRAPAALAGVVGYKPPHGRVPLEPPANAETWLHAGALARSVADVALMASAMAGPHPGDRCSLPAAPPLPSDFAPAAGMRVAFSARPGDLPVEAAVAANAERVAAALAAAGVEVCEVELDWRLEEINEAMWGHGDVSKAQAALAREAERPGTLSPYAVACFERALAAAAAIPIERRVALENRLRNGVFALFDSYDAVLVPTMGVAAMDAGEDYAARPLLVDGAPLDHFCDAALTPIFNIACCCPVLTVPSGLAPSGTPTGVQVAGAPSEDLTAFRLAQEIERVAPWGYPSGDLA